MRNLIIESDPYTQLKQAIQVGTRAYFRMEHAYKLVSAQGI